MDNLLWTAAFSLPLLALLYFEKGARKKHVLLGFFTLLFALPFEVLSVAAGLWTYATTPQVFSVSLFTLLAYFPWIIYSYWSGNALASHLRVDGWRRYLLCGLFGSLYAGFLFDPVSVKLGYYTFHSQPQIFGVPWVVIATEALCVAFVVFLFEKIWNKFLGNPPAPV